MSETDFDDTSSQPPTPPHGDESPPPSNDATPATPVTSVQGFILKILSGFHVGAEVDLNPDTTLIIGRDEACDIVLSEPSMAPQHGQLTMTKDGKALIKGITPSEQEQETPIVVAVNGKVVEDDTELQQGDIITLGRLHLAYGSPETPWHQLTIPSSRSGYDVGHDTPSESHPLHHDAQEAPHDETPSVPPIEGAVLTDHGEARLTSPPRSSFIRTILFLCIPLSLAVIPLFFLLHAMPPIPNLSMIQGKETSHNGFTTDTPEQNSEQNPEQQGLISTHSTPDPPQPPRPLKEAPPQEEETSSPSLKKRVEMLLESMEDYRGRFVVRESSHAVMIEGYVHAHHDFNVLRGMIEASIPQGDLRHQLRYRVTSTQTLAMAIRAELESRGFHNIGVQDHFDGTFAVRGLLASTKMFHRALLEITSSLPRLKHIDDNVATIDDVIRVIHDKTHEQGISLAVRHVHDDEQHEGTIEVKGLVNSEDYKKWKEVASLVSERYTPWLFLDDHVVNVRGFSLDVLSSVSGPHSFVMVREQKTGRGHYYTKGSLLPNGFRLKDIMADHLVLSWQGRDYTYVLGEDDDTRTTNLRP